MPKRGSLLDRVLRGYNVKKKAKDITCNYLQTSLPLYEIHRYIYWKLTGEKKYPLQKQQQADIEELSKIYEGFYFAESTNKKTSIDKREKARQKLLKTLPKEDLKDIDKILDFMKL
jgi:hypothetical protein